MKKKEELFFPLNKVKGQIFILPKKLTSPINNDFQWKK